MLLASLISASLLELALVPASARACSVGICSQGGFVPADGATIPENAGTFVWRTPRDFSAGTSGAAVLPALRLLRIDGAEPIEVKYDLVQKSAGLVWIEPASLTAGGRYRLEVAGDCATPAVEFAVAQAAPPPMDLGEITLSAARLGPVSAPTVIGSCDTDLPAVMVDVDIRLSSSAKPWADLLQYTTRVDDEVWAPAWTIGPEPPYDFKGAQTLIYAECPDPLAKDQGADSYVTHEGLEQGTHRVRIEAVVAGIDAVLKTSDGSATLSCEGAAAKPSSSAGDAGATSGVAASPDASAPSDAATPPDARATSGAAKSSDAGTAAGAAKSSSSGCSVTRGQQGWPNANALCPLALAVAWLCRGRRSLA